MVVYDVTNRESFKAVDHWMAEAEKFASMNTIKMLVGNRCHAHEERKVTIEEGREVAARYNIQFFETSVENSINVVEAFQALSKEMKDKVDLMKAVGGVKTCTVPFYNVAGSVALKGSSMARGKRMSGCC